jgi:hypothetical protein
MRVYHPIQWVEHIRWHEVLSDRRFWGTVGILVFVGLLTVLVIIAAKTGTAPPSIYGPGWPYGPYGPMPVP